MTQATVEREERFLAPIVNIIDQTDKVLIEAELPGVPKEGVELEVKDGELKMIGRRKAESLSGRTWVAERPHADYLRVFTLSRAVDPNTVKAEMKDGVLTVTLNKVEAMKPKRITIK